MGNIFSTNRIFKFWFQSQLQSKYSVYATRIVEFGSAAVKVAFLVSGASLIAFVSVLAAQSIFNFFLSAYYYTRTGERLLNWRFDSMYFKAMLRDSWPLALSIIAITMYVEIDNLMLGQLLDNYAVGVFGEAARISNMWYFIPAAIAASMYPVLVKSRQTLSVENYNRRVQKFLDVLVLIGYLSAVPASILAPFLISLFYGPEFAETGHVLSIYVWTFVFVGLREGMNRWLMVDNYTIYAMYVALVGAGTNIMLNFVFIPKFGVIGAAWATLISNIFALYGVCLVFPKLHPLLRQLILAIFAPFRIKSLIG
jgi:O-antigen/teichoic acid export membrane protein